MLIGQQASSMMLSVKLTRTQRLQQERRRQEAASTINQAAPKPLKLKPKIVSKPKEVSKSKMMPKKVISTQKPNNISKPNKSLKTNIISKSNMSPKPKRAIKSKISLKPKTISKPKYVSKIIPPQKCVVQKPKQSKRTTKRPARKVTPKKVVNNRPVKKAPKAVDVRLELVALVGRDCSCLEAGAGCWMCRLRERLGGKDCPAN